MSALTAPIEAPRPILPTLRPYQAEAARAILASVRERRGHTITVEIARQGGKNELSSQIELMLLTAASARDVEAVKAAPTMEPQLRISRRRLWQRITQSGLLPFAAFEPAAISIGRARLHFLSAEPHASVAGHTASLLLEADEAQDIDIDKFQRDFRPMTATTNATTVLYGTAWEETSLLERAKQANLEAERRDGVRRHFEYDWQHVAAHNPAYLHHVQTRIGEWGEDHPMFQTQYCLRTLAGGGRFLSPSQRAQLQGAHERIAMPVAGEHYAAGLDIAGGGDSGTHDATVLTIGRLIYPETGALIEAPRTEIVEHIAWFGEPHETLLPRLIDLLRDVWRVGRVAVDATGLGETVAALLAQKLGPSRVEAVKFTAGSKSSIGFALLGAINGGRLKAYRADGSPEHRAFSQQMERARRAFRANETMNFYVDPTDGHDDYLVSAALLVHASAAQPRRLARGRVA